MHGFQKGIIASPHDISKQFWNSSGQGQAQPAFFLSVRMTSETASEDSKCESERAGKARSHLPGFLHASSLDRTVTVV